MCEDLKNYYIVNKDSIDHAKVISHMLPIISMMINAYNLEFENSIAYLELNDEEKVKKRANLESSCLFIGDAIKQYSLDHATEYYLQFKDYSSEKLKTYGDQELIDRLNAFIEVVKPMVGELMPYGITNSRLKALHFHVTNFLPALPVHVTEIEQRKHAHRSALTCLSSIEEYLHL